MYLGLALNTNDRKKWEQFLMYFQEVVIIRKDFEPIPEGSNTTPLHLLFEVYHFDYYGRKFNPASTLIEEYSALDNIFMDDKISSAYRFAKIVLICHINLNSRATRKTPRISTLPKETFMNPWFWVRYVGTLKKIKFDINEYLAPLKHIFRPEKFISDDTYKSLDNNPILINSYSEARTNAERILDILNSINVDLTDEDNPVNSLKSIIVAKEYSFMRTFEIILINNLANTDLLDHIQGYNYTSNMEFWENYLWSII